ncbi:MAG TPA: twin-arginine translocation signal domain-containing protein [Caulobacteraceae bacterium]|jgi:hypothetical protein|nr:twin-arginine translocation signal domain-containing protein [Caulobacteraceae bacterium]
MSTIGTKTVIGATRRQLLGRAALAAGLAGAASAGLSPQALAEAVKLRPGDIGYQASPKGNARCELCVNWQAPNGCKVVSGTISPTGWCSLFVHKS